MSMLRPRLTRQDVMLHVLFLGLFTLYERERRKLR